MSSLIQQIRDRAAAERLAKRAGDLLVPSAPTRKRTAQEKMRGLQAQAAEHTFGGHATYKEAARICQVPMVNPELTPEEVEEVSEMLTLPRAFQGVGLSEPFRLHPIQAKGIVEFMREVDEPSGLLAPIDVGGGKTLISILCASLAFSELGYDRILLLIPSQVYTQFIKDDLPWARARVRVRCPFHELGTASIKKRLEIARSGARGCYVLPYSMLSSGKHGEELLRNTDPQVILADEAHSVSNRKAARTQRLRSFVNDRKPVFVALSGSITKKSLKDMFEVAEWCLGSLSPLPREWPTLCEWANVLDANAAPAGYQMGPVRPLLTWFEDNYLDSQTAGEKVENFRTSFMHRLHTTPGVAATTGTTIGASLWIEENEEVDEPSEELERLMTAVREELIDPTGEPIPHAINGYKWQYELTHGFYNERYWPTEEEWATKRAIPVKEAREELERARAHHELHKKYQKAEREYFKLPHRPGLDSPMLLGNELKKNGAKNLPGWLHAPWLAAREAAWAGMPKRLKRAVRVDDYKLRAAIEWWERMPKKDQEKGCLFFTYHPELARWLHELAEDWIWCPAGRAGNERIRDPENHHKPVIASLAHGQSKNLQYGWNRIYFVEMYRTATAAHQTLGRCHRNGQPEDDVFATHCSPNEFDTELLGAMLNDSLYQQELIGNPQRPLYATWTKKPQLYSSTLLRKLGFENKMLNESQTAKLKETFKQ